MTVRFALGLGLAALLVLLSAIGLLRAVRFARGRGLYRKRQWRRRGKKLRINDYVLKPGEAEPREP